MCPSPRQRLLTPAFVALSLADLFYFSAAGVLLAATPLFVVGPLGGGAAGVGVAMGAFSVATLVLRPFVGRWADRVGRRPLLIGGAALCAVLVVGHLLVEELAVLVGLRLLLGVAEALFFVAGFAAVADLAPPGRAGEALSLNSLSLFAGIALGPLLAQVLLARSGFAAVWWGAAVLAAVAVALAWRVPETLTVSDRSGPTALFHRAALWPGAGLLVGVACMSGFLAFVVLRAREVGLESWSVGLLVFGGVVVTARIALRTLPDRVRPLPLAAVSLALLAVGLLVVSAVATPVGLLSGTVVTGLGAALLTPAVFAAVFADVAPGERGTAAATLSIFIDLGLGGGPMLVGLVAALSSTSAALAVSAALALVAGVGTWLATRRGPRGVRVAT